MRPKTRGLRSADGDAHRVAVLGVANGLQIDRLATAQGPAQLADELAAVVQVDLLSDQGRPAAVGAAGAGRARLASAPGPAQLADELAAVVQVDLLSDQGRPAAVGAAVAVGCQGPDTL